MTNKQRLLYLWDRTLPPAVEGAEPDPIITPIETVLNTPFWSAFYTFLYWLFIGPPKLPAVRLVVTFSTRGIVSMSNSFPYNQAPVGTVSAVDILGKPEPLPAIPAWVFSGLDGITEVISTDGTTVTLTAPGPGAVTYAVSSGTLTATGTITFTALGASSLIVTFAVPAPPAPAPSPAPAPAA